MCVEFGGEGVMHTCVLTFLNACMHAYPHTHIGLHAGMHTSLPDRGTRRMLCRDILSFLHVCPADTGSSYCAVKQLAGLQEGRSYARLAQAPNSESL